MVQMNGISKAMDQKLIAASSTAETKTTTKTWTETIETTVASLNITTTSTTIVTVTTTISPKPSIVRYDTNEEVTSFTKSTENGSSLEKGYSIASVLSSTKNSWDMESHGCSDTKSQLFSPSIELDIILNDEWKNGCYQPQSQVKTIENRSDAVKRNNELSSDRVSQIPHHVAIGVNGFPHVSKTTEFEFVNSPWMLNDSRISHYGEMTPKGEKLSEFSVPLVVSAESALHDAKYVSPTPKMANVRSELDSTRLRLNIREATLIQNEAKEQINCEETTEKERIRVVNDNEPKYLEPEPQLQTNENLNHQTGYTSPVSISNMIQKIRSQIDLSTMKRRSLEERRRVNGFSNEMRENTALNDRFETTSREMQLSINGDVVSVVPHNESFLKKIEMEDGTMYQRGRLASADPAFVGCDVAPNATNTLTDIKNRIDSDVAVVTESSFHRFETNSSYPADANHPNNILQTTSIEHNDVSSPTSVTSSESKEENLQEENDQNNPCDDFTQSVGSSKVVEAERDATQQTDILSQPTDPERETSDTNTLLLQQAIDLTPSSSFDSAVLLLLECSQTSVRKGKRDKCQHSPQEAVIPLILDDHTRLGGDTHTASSENIQREHIHSSKSLLVEGGIPNGSQVNGSNKNFQVSQIVYNFPRDGRRRIEPPKSGILNTQLKTEENAAGNNLRDIPMNEPLIASNTVENSINQSGRMSPKDGEFPHMSKPDNISVETSRRESCVKSKPSRSKGSFFGFGLFNKKGKVEGRKPMPNLKRSEVEKFPSGIRVSHGRPSDLSGSTNVNSEYQAPSLLSHSFSDNESEYDLFRQSSESSEDTSPHIEHNELKLVTHNNNMDDARTETKPSHEALSLESETTAVATRNEISVDKLDNMQDPKDTIVMTSTSSEVTSRAECHSDTLRRAIDAPNTNETISTGLITNEKSASLQEFSHCIKYVLRLKKAVTDSILTEAEAESMTNLPKSIMHLIVYHFELCESSGEPIDWDAMLKLVVAFADSKKDNEQNESDQNPIAEF
jgi:hypothetical protein